jgi:hypothetical protein
MADSNNDKNPSPDDCRGGNSADVRATKTAETWYKPNETVSAVPEFSETRDVEQAFKESVLEMEPQLGPTPVGQSSVARLVLSL